MSGIIGDNVGRSSGLVKAAAAGATVDGRWTLLDTTTFGSDASTFDYEPTFMQSAYTYKLLKVSVWGLNPVDNDRAINMRWKEAASADGAIDASFMTSGYYSGLWTWDYSGTNHRSQDAAGEINLGWENFNQKGTSNKWFPYEFYIKNGGMTASTSGSTDYGNHMWWEGNMCAANDGQGQKTSGVGMSGYDIHGLQWFASSGNMDAGMICSTYYDNQLGSN